MPDTTPVLATASDLAARTGRPASDQVLLAWLEDASRRFRGAVGHFVNEVLDDTIELDGTGTRDLFLPAVPVSSVTSVSVRGSALPASAYTLSKRLGMLRLREGIWPREFGAIELTYSHGYPDDQIPDDVQQAVLEYAQVLAVAPVGVQSRTVLGDSISFGTAATVGVTESWSQAVANHRLGHGDRA